MDSAWETRLAQPYWINNNKSFSKLLYMYNCRQGTCTCTIIATCTYIARYMYMYNYSYMYMYNCRQGTCTCTIVATCTCIIVGKVHVHV